MCFDADIVSIRQETRLIMDKSLVPDTTCFNIEQQ